ncbi:MAG TPA: phosphopantetheine-binding protein [Clostridia bacterium]|nr:phosphopantetheine-binding protein [Clostridia bacterium]
MVFQKTAGILAGYKSVEESSIAPETTLEQLELDSLDKVELIMILEENFNVQIDAATPIERVQDLVEVIEKQLREGAV